MEKPTVWPAMARAFEAAQGDLALRLLAYFPVRVQSTRPARVAGWQRGQK